jgi:glutathione synthase/RimK-type ligase-like ATP-grasp enzyme
MSRFLIITEDSNLPELESNMEIMSPQDFIQNFKHQGKKNLNLKIINLCKSYDYLSKGYYVSLLSEARGYKCIPKVSDIIRLNWKRNYQSSLHELNNLLSKYYLEPEEEPLIRTYTSFLGRHENPKIEPLARKLFDLFRFPILSFEIEHSKRPGWQVNKIEAESITELSEKRMEFFIKSLNQFTGSAWKEKDQNKKQERYWLAILHDPSEKMPPSNKAALKKFIKIGKQMGLWVELITKNDFSSLLEFDALFIRETTAINSSAFRFASKAEQEDIPCIDDTQSIIKCCNKVFLNELMKESKIPTPETRIIDKQSLSTVLQEISFPGVLKIPDGSFSIGVEKVENTDEFKFKASEMLKKSEVILYQKFLSSEFDWRIGVLNNEPLYAVKYFMAENHWQIYNHSAKKQNDKIGVAETIPLELVPKEVLDIALSATKKIGNSLYGVDIKQLTNGEIVLIEVNDNPSIDSGVEDTYLGDTLYKNILQHFINLIEN